LVQYNKNQDYPGPDWLPVRLCRKQTSAKRLFQTLSWFGFQQKTFTDSFSPQISSTDQCAWWAFTEWQKCSNLALNLYYKLDIKSLN